LLNEQILLSVLPYRLSSFGDDPWETTMVDCSAWSMLTSLTTVFQKKLLTRWASYFRSLGIIVTKVTFLLIGLFTVLFVRNLMKKGLRKVPQFKYSHFPEMS